MLFAASRELLSACARSAALDRSTGHPGVQLVDRRPGHPPHLVQLLAGVQQVRLLLMVEQLANRLDDSGKFLLDRLELPMEPPLQLLPSRAPRATAAD